MKTRIFILILATAMMSLTTFAQDAISDFLKNKQNSTAANQNVESLAQEYFRGVINQEVETVLKFVHPNYVKELNGKAGAIELIESEFAVSIKEDFKIVGVKIKPNSNSEKSRGTTQKIKVEVVVQTEKTVIKFDGELTAILVGNNWYFVHQKSLLESFGVKEFNEAIAKDEQANNVSGGVINGKAISLPAPEYPKAAQAVGASGAVNVQVFLDEEGNVISAKALTGHPLLQVAAVDAAKKARFKPTIVNGQAIKVNGTIVYNFSK